MELAAKLSLPGFEEGVEMHSMYGDGEIQQRLVLYGRSDNRHIAS